MSEIEKLISGQDVFVSLPTGFRKSNIYELVPTIFDRLKGRLGRDTQHSHRSPPRVKYLIAYTLLSKLAGVREIITLTPCVMSVGGPSTA